MPPIGAEAPPIWFWNELSSNGLTKYTVLLWRNGVLSCDCPGWCNEKKDKRTGEKLPRTCRHVRKNEAEGKRLHSLHRRGQALPPNPATYSALAAPTPTPAVATASGNRVFLEE